MDLDGVARDLYGLTPDEFTRARNQRAKEIADSGDRRLASEIRQLPKPSSAAWLANALARRHRGAVEELTALGPTLGRAQRRADRADMRQAQERRRELVSALLHAATAIAADAGQSLGQHVERQLEQTLDAAVADSRAAVALRNGTLSAPLQFIGFGDSQPPTPSATEEPAQRSGKPATRTTRTKRTPDAASTPGRVGDRQAAAAAAAADRKLSKARARRDAAMATVVDARRQLDDATARVRSATTELRKSEQARDRATAAFDVARRTLIQVEQVVRDAEREHGQKRQPKVKS